MLWRLWPSPDAHSSGLLVRWRSVPRQLTQCTRHRVGPQEHALAPGPFSCRPPKRSRRRTKAGAGAIAWPAPPAQSWAWVGVGRLLVTCFSPRFVACTWPCIRPFHPPYTCHLDLPYTAPAPAARGPMRLKHSAAPDGRRGAWQGHNRAPQATLGALHRSLPLDGARLVGSITQMATYSHGWRCQ